MERRRSLSTNHSAHTRRVVLFHWLACCEFKQPTKRIHRNQLPQAVPTDLYVHVHLRRAASFVILRDATFRQEILPPSGANDLLLLGRRT